MSHNKSIEFEPDNTQTTRRGRILVVDDEPNIRTTLKMVLETEGFHVDTAKDGEDASQFIDSIPPDTILLDVRLPKVDGITLMKRWHSEAPHIPIILMSGEASLTEALEGLKVGAYDFLEKPLVKARVVNMILRSLEKRRLLEGLKEGSDPIIGKSDTLLNLMSDVHKIATLKTRVLIVGESGTGKDLIAKAIHKLSARSKKNFVKINCAAIPENLIESELFGHVKGAFTGAICAKRGLFEVAHGGTLFLDEVGELSAAAQAKLLRVLQNNEVTPVGSHVTIPVDVRVVAATNKDLKTEVELNHFREDLYYRLAVVCLQSPPLRERSTDIPLLAEYFIETISRENGLPPKKVEEKVFQHLQSYPWPGNIRELRNTVERLLILGGPIIGVENLPTEIRNIKVVAMEAISKKQHFEPKTWENFKVQSERQFLIDTIKYCEGNISEAARILKVERSTVHKWLKTYQIEKQHYLL
ncbi:MAG: sigma-54-dependent transcriptional regulator [Oligoflexales bacterium]